MCSSLLRSLATRYLWRPLCRCKLLSQKIHDGAVLSVFVFSCYTVRLRCGLLRYRATGQPIGASPSPLSQVSCRQQRFGPPSYLAHLLIGNVTSSSHHIPCSATLFTNAATLLKGLRSSTRKLRLPEYDRTHRPFHPATWRRFHVVKTRWITGLVMRFSGIASQARSARVAYGPNRHGDKTAPTATSTRSKRHPRRHYFVGGPSARCGQHTHLRTFCVVPE